MALFNTPMPAPAVKSFFARLFADSGFPICISNSQFIILDLYK